MTTVSATVTPRPAQGLTGRLAGQGLFGTAVRALGVRVLGPLSAFGLTLLLARTLGAEGTGVFYAVLTLMTALATAAKFGMETALQRFVGAALARHDQAAVLGIYHQALLITGSLALLAGSMVYAFAGTLSALLFREMNHAPLVQVLGLALVPFTLLGVQAAMLKAIGKPAWGGFFEAAAWPLFTLLLVAAAALGSPLTTLAVGYGHLFGMVIALVAGYSLLRRQLPTGVTGTPLARPELLASCLPLTVVELVNYALLWTPFLIIPMLADAAEAGLYNVSHRLSAQLALVMIVFASITAPRFAAHYQARDDAALAALAGNSTRTMLAFGLPVALILLVWPEWLLGLFGDEFTAAGDVLRILAAGQLVNLATGPVGYLLAMTGAERVLRNVVISTLAITVPLALLLIPTLGAVGAALAVAIPMIFHNLACCALAARRLSLPFFLLFAR